MESDINNIFEGKIFLKAEEVIRILRMSRAAFYKGIAEGIIPKPYTPTGQRSALWKVEEIKNFINNMSKK